MSTIANGEVLLESQNYIFEHLSFPFTVLTNEPLTNEFWGVSDFEVAEKVIDWINEQQNILLDD